MTKTLWLNAVGYPLAVVGAGREAGFGRTSSRIGEESKPW